MSVKFNDLLGTGFVSEGYALSGFSSPAFLDMTPTSFLDTLDYVVGPAEYVGTQADPPLSIESAGVANVIMGDLLNTDNVSDSTALNLNSAWGIFSVEFGGTTYVYASGQIDNGFSIFEMDSNGDLTHLANVDDNVATALTGARQIQSLDISGTTYMYVSAATGTTGAINVFSIDTTTGMPTFIEAVVDNGALNLENSAGRMSFVEVGTKTFLIASAFDDDGLSVFEIGTDGRLIANTYNVSDSTNLNAAYDTATIEVGGNDFVFAVAAAGDSLTTYQMDANGDLIFINRLTEATSPGFELNGAVGLATASINATEFLFVSGFDDDGISVFSVSSSGALTNVFNLSNAAAFSLDGAHGMDIIEISGETFLSVVSRGNDAISLFHVSASGALTQMDNTISGFLDNAIYVEGITKDGNPFLVGTALNSDSLAVFEIGGGNDNLNGSTTTQDLVLGLRGNDIIRPQLAGPSGDIYDGGEGIDTVNISGNSGDYTVDLQQGLYFTTSAPSVTVELREFENIFGGNGDDTLTGDGGNNEIYSGGGSDVVSGGAGDDDIFLNGTANTVYGGSGDDTFTVNTEGSQTSGHIFYGGSGFDTIDLRALGTGPGLTLSYSSIEQYYGADYSGTWYGGSEDNFLYGAGGNDTIFGNNGDDEIYGGTDNDTLDGGSGADIIYGNSGDDIINGGAGADELYGGPGGGDTLTYDTSTQGVTVNLSTGLGSGGHAEGDIVSGFEFLIGSGFDDVLTGTSLSSNNINGGAGDDTLIDVRVSQGDVFEGGAGMDTLVADQTWTDAVLYDLALGWMRFPGAGGTTYDTISGIENLTIGGGADVNGDANDNVITILDTGPVSTNTINGGSGDDTIYAGIGDDIISGGDGDDTIFGGTGDDNITANAGNDIIDGGDGNDDIEGNDGDDIINGGAGNDILLGSFGDDILDGGAGADSINGGDDSDIVTYATSLAGVTVDLLAGTGLGGDAEGDTLAFIEHIIGSAFDDSLTGDDGDNTLIGGMGVDNLDGGLGIDTADYSGSSAAVNINLNSGAGNGGDAAGDNLSNIEILLGSDFNDTLTGNTGDNILMGGDGNDTLNGLGGNDTLDGGNGNDTLIGAGADDLLIGGDGADVLNGSTGRDTASYSTSDGRVVVNLLAGTAGQNHAAGDTLTAIEDLIGSAFNDILTGTNARNILHGGDGGDLLKGLAGRDDLFGEGGDDTLQGGGAADRLDGGAGNDTLNGGTARDVFVFSDGFGQDIIQDFTDNFDDIDFSGHSGFNNFTDVTNATFQDPNGLDVIIQDGSNSIRILNFDLTDMDAADFIF